jgi:HSP20 family protein
MLRSVDDERQQAHWLPAADVYRTRNGWLVKFDLAGVRPDDIRLDGDGNRLTVAGIRRDELVDEGVAHYRMEISYSSFRRTVELPISLDTARVETEMRDGMLLVRIPTEPVT